jgi:hypothetical protein
LTALSLYIGILLGVIGLLYAIFTSGPQPPPEDILRRDALENVEILGRKLIVADDLFQRMRQAEKNGDKNPYVNIANRMKRDLPAFDLSRAIALENARANKEPFKTYIEVNELLKSIEESEHTDILFFHNVIDRAYGMQVHVPGVGTFGTADMQGLPFIGQQMRTLEGNYLIAYPILQTYLKRIGIEQIPAPPKDLYVLKELVELRALNHQKEQ